jgi:type I restriction enzyme M protein
MQPAFQENEFRFEDAAGLLKKEFGDEEKQVLTILSTMKKEGYLDVKKDSENARRKIYTLLKPNTDIVKGIGEGERLTRDDVEKILKRGADLIRTRVDYKFILVLLFL